VCLPSRIGPPKPRTARDASCTLDQSPARASYGGQQWDAAFISLKRHFHTVRSVAATSVVLLSAGPGVGQSLPIPLLGFSHHAYVLAPVVLDIDGRLLAPTGGTTFAAGSATN
jgi:hypothetical protein